ncbi:serine/threonine-protein kinase [Oxynema aestuarii]|jgi:Tol biopolymer transport system component|uniref:Protein kinase n=1 Tax=Oxynema aestuarii AP17 TaxID=2064643 RepID=A0A6H1TT80_9CYAN|nr:serine/threonine-protein kinase [Oxynema aestuarii]QIZ69818.1 protein kinase [Oxynema aestuarii AP17]
MSHCINPNCPKPTDPLNAYNRICRQCGSQLLVQGRYQVVKLLGVGGFGKTYEALEKGTPKVLKVLVESNPKAIALFQQEAAVLQRLKHPGIPRVDPWGYFTYFANNSRTPIHCLVMEKIEGQNLEEWLHDRGNIPITENQAIDWLCQLAEILHQVHAQQYFHRDLKPSNIMLRAAIVRGSRTTEQLALIDFGSARAVSTTYLAKMAIGQKGTVIASKGYAPPEQENGKTMPQSDFYALGRTFVHLLTGRHPLDFYDPHTDRLEWRVAAPHISREMADFIDYLMARLPGQRPPNTEVLLQQLEDLKRANRHRKPVPMGLSPARGRRRKSPSVAGLRKIASPLMAASAIAAIAGVGLSEVKIYRYAIDRLHEYQQAAAEQVGRLGIDGGSTLEVTPVKAAIDRPQERAIATLATTDTPEEVTEDITLSNTLTGHAQDVRSLAISPDGQLLASGSFDGTIKIWNLQTGQPIRTLTSPNPGQIVSSVAISPDGRTLVSSSNSYGGTIQIWDLATGQLLASLSPGSSGAFVVAISPDGTLLASGSEKGSIKLWDLASGSLLQTLTGHVGTVYSVAFSPDGTTLASGSEDGSIKLWQLENTPSGGLNASIWRHLSGHVGKVFSVAFSPDGKHLASGGADKTVKLWNLETGKQTGTLLSHAGIVFSVAFSPDGETLASGSFTGRINLWDVDTGQRWETPEAHSRWVETVAFSPDGHTLASGSGDRTIKIWGVR